MNIRSRWLLSRRRAAALALGLSLVGFGAPGARAQMFNGDAALPAAQVERMIQASGYRLTGPVIRHGAVYLANVLGRDDDPERLIIDAREGRLLQRFPAAGRRQTAAVGGWFNEPPQSGGLFGWFGADEDEAAPRPPAGLDAGPTSEPLHAAPARTPVTKQMARSEDDSVPHVIMGPTAAPTAVIRAPLLEKPRLRPQAHRRKVEPTPVAQPANAPAVATPTAAISGPAAPSGAETKPTPAVVAAPAPAPKAPAAKPALNDVPVAPLE